MVLSSTTYSRGFPSYSSNSNNIDHGADHQSPIEDVFALLREPMEETSPMVLGGFAPQSSSIKVIRDMTIRAPVKSSAQQGKEKEEEPSKDGPMARKPKRSLNTYNFFFQHHRRLIYDQVPAQGVVGFKGLATMISMRWKKATDEEKAYFEKLAQEDKIRHKQEMEIWNEQQKQFKAQQLAQQQQQQQNNKESDELQHLVTQEGMHALAQALGNDCLETVIHLFK